LDKRIDQMMPELGFTPADNDRLVASFSGGWQMRMCLGKLLLQVRWAGRCRGGVHVCVCVFVCVCVCVCGVCVWLCVCVCPRVWLCVVTGVLLVCVGGGREAAAGLPLSRAVCRW
jgi:hypothetical protein